MQHPGLAPVVTQGPGHDTHHGLAQDRHAAMVPPSHQHQQHTSHHMIIDPSQMAAQQRIGTPHFDATGSVITPMYQGMPHPTPTQGHQVQTRAKRPRPDDLEMPVHGVPNLSHSQHMGMHPLGLGPPYAQAGPPAIPQPPPTHHHHRLPDSEPSAKVMRREDGGGAPSVVGQEGMPEPAARPKGPKLKFTADDDKLLVELKEQKNLTWKQIADFFPGRSSGTLQVRYCTKLKAKTKQWNDEMDQKLRTALDDYENEKWRIVSSKLGAGFTPAACRDRADQLWGGGPVEGPIDFDETASPPEVSTTEPNTELYPQYSG